MAARPPRGLCSPVSSTDGLEPTLAGLEPCIGHHDYSSIEQTFLTFLLKTKYISSPPYPIFPKAEQTNNGEMEFLNRV